MANPTYANIHVDGPLTNISVAYIQEQSAFVADKVFPIIPVKKQSDRYFVYLKEDWFRDEATERAPDTESAGGGYEIDNTPSYFCKIYAYHKEVTEAERQNSDDPLKPDEDAAQFITQKLLLRREVDFVSRFFATGLWTTEYTGAAATANLDKKYWSSSGSTPVIDIGRAKLAVANVTGCMPNVLLCGAEVAFELLNHDDTLQRIKYTQGPAIATEALLAQLFGLDKVVVGRAVKNASAKGATEDTDFILGKSALLCYAAPSPGIKQPSAGYIFGWTGLEGAGAYGNRLYKLPMDIHGLGTVRVEGEMAYDCELVSADLGVFFNGIVQ
jgi:hypothetical protein